ncbi:spore gernimation protein [Mycolicibacterium fortuitum]|nr:spore gernimation protein [Mycolicibacterium fortuitum]
MNFVVRQSITIQCLNVSSITNSSILQIGSSGVLNPLSNLHNTGGFTGPAPEAGESQSEVSLVPLPPPGR